MSEFPSSHIDNALTLRGAEPEIDLFELTPSDGTGVLAFKPDDTVTWLGRQYAGIPMSFSGDQDSASGSTVSPRMVLGQPNSDLSMFKNLIREGTLDNATIIRKTVLLADIIADRDIKVIRGYRVGVVEGYGRSSITMLLRKFSGARRTTMPFLQFLPPAFPHVKL